MVTTKHYFQKKIILTIFGQNLYGKIKFCKILFDYILNKDYDNIYSFWSSYLKEDSVIIDVGANMGQCMMRYSKNNKKGLVISIEPVKKTYYFLKKASSLLSRKNVIMLNIALGNEKKHTEIYIPVTNEGVIIDTQASLNEDLFQEKKISYITLNPQGIIKWQV